MLVTLLLSKRFHYQEPKYQLVMENAQNGCKELSSIVDFEFTCLGAQGIQVRGVWRGLQGSAPPTGSLRSQET